MEKEEEIGDKMACTYCIGLPEWVIKKYDFWTVYLKKNQAYPGTVILALNRHIPDLFSASPEEMEELQRIVVKIRETLKDLLGAKMFSYVSQSSLENLHANIQIIPRYDGEVILLDYKFTDPNFGRGYNPVRNTQLETEDYKKLIEMIKQKLEKAPEKESEEGDEESEEHEDEE